MLYRSGTDLSKLAYVAVIPLRFQAERSNKRASEKWGLVKEMGVGGKVLPLSRSFVTSAGFYRKPTNTGIKKP